MPEDPFFKVLSDEAKKYASELRADNGKKNSSRTATQIIARGETDSEFKARQEQLKRSEKRLRASGQTESAWAERVDRKVREAARKTSNKTPSAPTPKPTSAPSPSTTTPPNVQSYAKGGQVKRTGLALVHKGERVLTRKQERKYNRVSGRR
jgi:hypothetical protein